MKVLLVDDEPLARRELRRLLEDHPDAKVVGEAGDVTQARERIEALRPDVLLLDIQMPGGTGFDLLEQLDDLPLVIFTTAFDHHAVRAFEVSALDYLLKPVEPERLSEALERARQRLAHRPVEARRSEAPLEQLFVRDGDRCWLVPLREVRLLASEGNYVRLFWKQEEPLVGRALHQLEQRLDPRSFFRASRKHLVNLDHVETIEPGLGGRLHIQLRGGPEVEVSRRQARELKARMGA